MLQNNLKIEFAIVENDWFNYYTIDLLLEWPSTWQQKYPSKFYWLQLKCCFDIKLQIVASIQLIKMLILYYLMILFLVCFMNKRQPITEIEKCIQFFFMIPIECHYYVNNWIERVMTNKLQLNWLYIDVKVSMILKFMVPFFFWFFFLRFIFYCQFYFSEHDFPNVHSIYCCIQSGIKWNILKI